MQPNRVREASRDKLPQARVGPAGTGVVTDLILHGLNAVVVDSECALEK